MPAKNDWKEDLLYIQMVSKTQRNFDKCDINTLKIEKKNGQTIANKQSALERKDKKKS